LTIQEIQGAEDFFLHYHYVEYKENNQTDLELF